MKAKASLLLRDDGEFSPSDFVQVAALPEVFEPSKYSIFTLEGTDASQGAKTLATRVRGIASSAEITGLGELQLNSSNEVRSTRPSESGGKELASQSPVSLSSSLGDDREEGRESDKSVVSGISAAQEEDNEEGYEGTKSATSEASAGKDDSSERN